MLALLTACMIAFPLVGEQLPVDIVGVSVTPHTFSQEVQWMREPNPELGSLVRIVVEHRGAGGEALPLSVTINGRSGAEWLAAEEWSWYDLPENRLPEETSYVLAPGHIDVFSFNGDTAAWSLGEVITVIVCNAENGACDAHDITLALPPVRLMHVVFPPDDDAQIHPKRMVAHVLNAGAVPVQLTAFHAYAAGTDGMVAVGSDTAPAGFLANADIHAGERGGAVALFDDLPLRRGVLEAVYSLADGTEARVFAPMRFKVDRVDIGSGWLATPTAAGVQPLTQESFLKLLHLLHVNLAHIEEVSGYTDNPELYGRFPLRLMGYFRDLERYNTDEWVRRIHGVDRLGEPQHDRTSPMQTFEILRAYDNARYPTTVTLSEEQGYRYYAGFSDFPHYDQYRVAAPRSDAWGKYDRFGSPLSWGAPMETIGEMTRTLRALSRPVPIGYWSQNVHPGWRSTRARARNSPTADEILMQAHQGLANGIIGLYWYSLETWSTLRFRDTLDMTRRIGREIRMLEDFYLEGDATWHRRITDGAGQPSLDLNVVAAPHGALLFAMDLAYEPDVDDGVFIYRETRALDEVFFPLPAYLREPVSVFRADADGVHAVDWEVRGGGIVLSDTLDKTAVYVATREPGMIESIAARHAALVAAEVALGFDPIAREADFDRLVQDLGYESVETISGR